MLFDDICVIDAGDEIFEVTHIEDRFEEPKYKDLYFSIYVL